MNLESAANLKARQRAHNRLYAASRRTASGLAMLVKAILRSVPGTSCGLTSLSNDFKVLSSFPCLFLALRIDCRISPFLGLVKYITILPLSVLKPNAESSSVWIEVGASSTSDKRKISLTVACSLSPGTTSCFFVVVT